MTDPRTVPSFTTQLWSDEVGLADAAEPPTPAIGYRFSNGRKFVQTPYDAPVPPPLTDP